jgi:hypothetical protein
MCKVPTLLVFLTTGNKAGTPGEGVAVSTRGASIAQASALICAAISRRANQKRAILAAIASCLVPSSL